jgi:ABC-type glutathione transport system ATPase component
MTDATLSFPLLELRAVSQTYALPRTSPWSATPRLQALQQVSLQVLAGRNMAIVGESGSGKSTLARLAMALERPSAGQVLFEGQDVNAISTSRLRELRRHFQMVFQDPYSSLDPRQRVLGIVTEPLSTQASVSASEMREQAAEILSAVGLRSSDLEKYPHEFSGGQRQRIALARALISRPRLIVADEPLSALDVSVQAQVLNLMMDLQDRYGITYLLISHDLAVVQHLCDDVCVMQRGQVVEQGPPLQLFGSPQHPCTQALVAAVAGI